MPYWRLHYHLVWATHERHPFIGPAQESILHTTLRQKARSLGLILHAFGNVEDHVHLVVSIPPTLAVSDCLRHFKGAASRAINAEMHGASPFQWQGGYGAISLGERSLPAVIAYALNQKEHHRAGMTIALYERMTGEDDGPPLPDVGG